MTSSISTETVYIVDDDSSIRKTLSKSLSKRGYNVQAYSSAVEYLEYLESTPPEQSGCLLVDLCMPIINGLELQAKLNRRGAQLPIIFMTGHGSVHESVNALRAGALDFLEKPFAPLKLINRIEEAFALNRKIRAKSAAAIEIQERLNQLSEREREVMELMIAEPDNLSTKEIASTLGISHRTVDIHRSRVMHKVQVNSIFELTYLIQLAA